MSSSLDAASRVSGRSTYIAHRQREKAVGATIRRELSTLMLMPRLAYGKGKLLRLPPTHKPKEGPPREGFFERDQ